ncbi:MAG: hypothetical protein D6782_06610 [Alphaproteobacteria bacterium]|nr:MAG: hypothetical protein D6782_06610 [Alphaproteobacteria bacterium]
MVTGFLAIGFLFMSLSIQMLTADASAVLFDDATDRRTNGAHMASMAFVGQRRTILQANASRAYALGARKGEELWRLFARAACPRQGPLPPTALTSPQIVVNQRHDANCRKHCRPAA